LGSALGLRKRQLEAELDAAEHDCDRPEHPAQVELDRRRARYFVVILPFREAFPIFHTTDLERVVAFYVERLGLEERYRLEGEFVAVGLGSFEIGFARSAKIDPAGRVALWFYCDDVDAEVAALRDAGAEITREPADMDWGERMAIVLDPDGNEICLGQKL
jgi:predicted enzyme related to lactoylglutathione lyase